MLKGEICILSSEPGLLFSTVSTLCINLSWQAALAWSSCLIQRSSKKISKCVWSFLSNPTLGRVLWSYFPSVQPLYVHHVFWQHEVSLLIWWCEQVKSAFLSLVAHMTHTWSDSFSHTHTHANNSNFTSVLCPIDLWRKVLQYVGLPVCHTLFLLWVISSWAPDSFYSIMTPGFTGCQAASPFSDDTLTLHTY